MPSILERKPITPTFLLVFTHCSIQTHRLKRKLIHFLSIIPISVFELPHGVLKRPVISVDESTKQVLLDLKRFC